MHADMSCIERALGLERRGYGSDAIASGRASVPERFRLLQENVLAMRMRRFGLDPRSLDGLDFFSRQAAFRAHLADELLSRYAVDHGSASGASDSIERTIHRQSKVVQSSE